MEQKFIKLEDATEMLGISAEQLNGLREHGKLRAYRDGASWKFRSDEIEAMVRDGVPDLAEDSDLGLAPLEDLEDLAPLSLDDGLIDEAAQEKPADPEPASPPTPEESGLELELGDTDPLSAGSELELEDLEDTVTAGTSDPHLGLPDEPSDPSDSILLSEETLGESVSPSSSTIIGKSNRESDDADLELVSDDDLDAEQSDLELPSAGASDVLSSDTHNSDVLDQLESSSAGASGFEDLEELEIDLAAESSRILSPDDVSKAQAAAGQPMIRPGDSGDLALEEEPSISGDENDMGSTDVPLLEPEEATDSLTGEGSGSEIELAGDDDIVLSDAEGSDITLDSGDSGINLAPADSGLALDDIPLEIGGSAILSSLDLGGSDPEISLVSGGTDVSEPADEQEAELQTDDDFQLTPLSEGAPDEDGDSSSQVIALDADIDDLGDDVGVLDEDVGFAEDVDDGVMLAEDFGEAPADDLEMGTYAGTGTAAAAAAETPYSVGQILGLGSCAVLMMLACTMMLDMMRNIWSWDQPYTLSSSLIDAILGLFS